MTRRATGRNIVDHSAALQRHTLLATAIKLQNQFHVSQSMQQARVNHVHQVREIQRPLRPFGPSPIGAEELSGSPMPQQTLDRLIKFHASKFSSRQLKQKWGEALGFLSCKCGGHIRWRLFPRLLGMLEACRWRARVATIQPRLALLVSPDLWHSTTFCWRRKKRWRKPSRWS